MEKCLKKCQKIFSKLKQSFSSKLIALITASSVAVVIIATIVILLASTVEKPQNIGKFKSCQLKPAR